MLFISVICFYLLIGLIYGVRHADLVVTRLTQVGVMEDQLKSMVKMYKYSPKGAEYYMELQELHIKEKETLEEYKLYEKDRGSYVGKTFTLALLFWPYYLVAVKK